MNFGRVRLTAGLVIACVLAVGPGSASAAGAGVASPAELVHNGSFEQNTDGNNVPDGWASKGLPATGGQVCSGEVHTGSCAVKIPLGRTRQLSFTRNIDGNAGEDITFSLWSNAQSALGGKLSARVTITYWNNRRQSWTILIPREMPGWQQSQISLTPTRAYRKINVILRATGAASGDLWLDDASLSVAPSGSGWAPPLTAADWMANPVHGAVVEIGFGGPDEFEDPPYPSVDGFRLLRELGVHVVVIEFQYAWTIFPPYQPAEDQFAIVTAALDNARDAGLDVVLADRSGPGVNAMYPGIADKDVITTLYTDPVAQEAYRDMLTDMVNRYKDRPEIIAWEPIIEPAPDYFLYHEEAPYSQGAAVWNPLAESLIQTIRAADPDRPIIIEPVNWGGFDAFTTFTKFSDDNVIYSLHTYEPYSYSDQSRFPYRRYPGRFDGGYVNKAALDSFLAPVDDFQALHNVPIYVGEWGGIRWVPGMNRYIADQLSLFNVRGWSWTIYAWYDAEWDQKGYMPALGKNRRRLVYNPFNPVFAPVAADWASMP